MPKVFPDPADFPEGQAVNVRIVGQDPALESEQWTTKGAVSDPLVVAVLPLTSEYVIDIQENGRLLYLVLYSNYGSMYYYFEVDGTEFPWYFRENEMNNFTHTAGQGGFGINLAQYDIPNDDYSIIVTIPIQWQSRFRVRARNGSLVNPFVVTATACYLTPPG